MEEHKDDAMSVCSLVGVQEVVCHGKQNTVLFYKLQIGVHDFALVLQTPLQSEMFKSCGNNQVICVDATHGTNSYDFVLIPVLVIDELGEGFPVAWWNSNKEDLTLLKIFFQHLKFKEHVGSVSLYRSCQMMQTIIINVGVKYMKTNHTWHDDRALA